MVSGYIYIEGGAKGADSKFLKITCQQAFRNLLDKLGYTGRQPRLVACGGRDEVYRRFCTAHAAAKETYVAMWIDSEEPVNDLGAAWDHLARVTTVGAWQRPEGAKDEQVLFMATCMETWIMADRETLRNHFGSALQENALPVADLEKRDRHSIQDGLAHATRRCKNCYEKGKRSFDLFGKLNPEALAPLLPQFVRVREILDAQL